ncbi:MAG: hypothetical protein M1813_008232 [Trichoglossum hirsutum]|nr:MAG: hypothetical protein M1813_008232 [Trichoglossum hirsutum]
MPRKAFLADLEAALGSSTVVDRISDLKAGEEYGSFSFTFTPLDSTSEAVAITALVFDLSKYPLEHQIMLYTTSDGPPSIDFTLQDITASLKGVPIERILSTVSNCLNKALSGTRSNPITLEEEDDDDANREGMPIEEHQDVYGHGDDTSESDWSDQSTEENHFGLEELNNDDDPHVATKPTSKASVSTFCSRIRSDLKAAKDAGFKVGYLGHLMEGRKAYVSVSCRVSKLGISEEAMRAWQFEKRMYLVFLIEYSFWYMSFEELMREERHRASNIKMLVGASTHYKPTWSEAISAFREASKRSNTVSEENRSSAAPSVGGLKAGAAGSDTSSGVVGLPTKDDGFRGIFIGAPLYELLNGRLLRLLRYRVDMRFGWSGAEQFYNDHLGVPYAELGEVDDRYTKYYVPEIPRSTLPSLVIGDQLSDLQTAISSRVAIPAASFPLIGMQFVLRHLVRCTEFCMVCHCKVTSDLESLKPYVCSQPLCLYQYMALCFGPSIEYEILAHPRVADLLVSFCYASALSGRLKDFPTGMNLIVPMPDAPGEAIEYCRDRREITFGELTQGIPGCPVRVGDWIILGSGAFGLTEMHCRVADISLFPIVKLGFPVLVGCEEHPCPSEELPTTTYFTKYDQNFDQLPDALKRRAIVVMLATLPSIAEMRLFIICDKHAASNGGSLHRWHDRLSSAALGILRWIIASNRSCLVEVVDSGRNDVAGCLEAPNRVVGMPNWKQFRFAMGAPDKEQRFFNSLRALGSDLNLDNPTIFAWHGSGMGNWHSIVREGFNFNEVVNGRAYGNGVYHTLDSRLGAGYSQVPLYGKVKFTGWPRSELRIRSVMCLNEIVNATEKFVSRYPHLVVAQLEWIQTRYLFVKCSNRTGTTSEEPNILLKFLPQDPFFFVQGDDGSCLGIPSSAMRTSNRFRLSQGSMAKAFMNNNKRRRLTGKEGPTEVGALTNDGASVDTDIEDIELLFSDNDDRMRAARNRKGRLKATVSYLQPTQTGFVPGILDHSSLPILGPPAYATSTATNAIQRELRKILKLQETQPLHELGWYIDPEHIENVYQWVMELHSFDLTLPLSLDLLKAGTNSVVLEVRFGKEFPTSPPFVRVIRPRFLNYSRGGGGHVTSGGAMCMELLTNTGWIAESTMESVLLQVRVAITSTDPFPARLVGGCVGDYTVREAIKAYARSCIMHGWEIPKDLWVLSTLAETSDSGNEPNHLALSSSFPVP